MPGLVHADKPLAGGAVNQRGFVAPAMRIAMFDFGVGQQAAVFLQPFGNHGVGFPHSKAGHARHIAAVAAFAVYRIIQFDAVFQAHEIIVQAVRRRGVHQARACFGGNVVAVEHRNIALEERMLEMQVFQLGAAGFGQHGAVFKAVAFERFFGQIFGQHQFAFGRVD